MPTAFTAAPSTLRELILQAGQGFYVPIYQRDYTWDDTQIDRLFEDIGHGITRCAQGSSPSTFLGSVILVSDRDSVFPKDDSALPTTVHHVVDGQQRLTTFLVTFACMIRIISESMEFLQAAIQDGSPTIQLDNWLLTTLGERREELFDAIGITTYAGVDHFRHKPRLIRQATDVWGNNEASAHYESDIAWILMQVIRRRHENNGSGSISVPEVRGHLRRIVKCVNDNINSVIEGDSNSTIINDLSFLTNIGIAQALIASKPEPIADPLSLDEHRKCAARILAFSSFMLTGILVIDVRAPDEDYAFSLFEPLNATGQLLTALETLKPLVVQSEGGIATYGFSPSADAFERIEAHLPTSLNVDKRTRLSSELLTTFSLAESGERLSHTLLDQRRFLRSQFRSHAPPVESIDNSRAFVNRLARSSDFFFDVWSIDAPPFLADATELDRLCLAVLQQTKHSIVTGVLSRYFDGWLADPTQSNRQDFLGVVRALAGFWALWRTSRPTTRGIDDIHRNLMANGYPGTHLPPLAWRPSEGGSLPQLSDFKSALRSILASRGNIHTKADWSAAVVTQPIYQTTRQLAKFVLLAAHQDRIADLAAPGLISLGAPGTFSALTVRAWEDHYTVEHIAPQSHSPGDNTYEQGLYDQGLTDRLGNLTLMPSNLNALVSNRPWTFKREVYEILSMTDPAERVSQLKESLPDISATTTDVLELAEYLPFCEYLSNFSSSTFTVAFVSQRGNKLAELAADQLWSLIV